jgi:hypothetical protein
MGRMGAASVIVGVLLIGGAVLFALNALYCRQLIRAGYRPRPKVRRTAFVPGGHEATTVWDARLLNGFPVMPLAETSFAVSSSCIEEMRRPDGIRIERELVELVRVVPWNLQGDFVVFVGPSQSYRSLAIAPKLIVPFINDLAARNWPLEAHRS